ncbi:MAG: hypothetical protein GH151_06410 [Bacteroidetes bacterium]|nr:hypothetical protein [Bacteroidota bacterium]
MKKEIIITGLVLILGFAGCKKDEPSIITSGTATLTSTLVLEGSTYSYYGFSFEKGDVLKYNPELSDEWPDIVIRPITEPSGDVTGAYLDSPNIIENSFNLTAEFENETSATDFFNNYKTVDVTNFLKLAKPILKYQVWTFKTSKKLFAKLLIVDVQTDLKINTPYAETTFKWLYQPDGSNEFDN